jgi:hypothetical protein
MRLNEDHKKLAEDLLRGTPVAQIARDLGKNRATLYTWMRDPTWLAYYAALAEEVSAARIQRLLPVSMKAAEAVECALSNAVTAMTNDDPLIRAAAPGLDILTRALKTVVELERVDRGAPVPEKHNPEKPTGKGELSPQSQRLVDALETMTRKGKEAGVTEEQEDEAEKGAQH